MKWTILKVQYEVGKEVSLICKLELYPLLDVIRRRNGRLYVSFGLKDGIKASNGEVSNGQNPPGKFYIT
jgi:hypothetical protein